MCSLTFPEPEFLINPYVVRGGITFLWGDTSIGKSPLTWEMAASIGSGRSFFGLPTTRGRVLYLDVDTPTQSLQKRVKRPNPPEGVWFLTTTPLSVPFLAPEGEALEELKEAAETVRPDVVFINTLRKVHDLDDKEPRTPKLVYSFFQRLFKGSALVFVHHEKKHSPDPRFQVYEKESFSGAKNWLNDAQVGIHLETFSGERWKENLRLWHRKSQVSAQLRPLPLFLDKDGSTMTSPLYEELLATYEWMNANPGLPAGEADVRLAAALKVGVGTAKKRRLTVERGEFPGSTEFLGTAEEE